MRNCVLLPSLVLVLALAALAGCGDRSVEHAATSPSSGASLTEIPDDFPLGDLMTDPADELPTSRTGTGLRDLTVCGTSPLRGLGLRDRMVADNSGGEAVWPCRRAGPAGDPCRGPGVRRLPRAAGHGEGSLQSLSDQAADVTDVTTAITPAMCPFTSAGC